MTQSFKNAAPQQVSHADTAWLKNRLEMQDRLQQGGVWSPDQEHDACGVGMVAAIDGKPSRQVVEKGIEALRAVWHRGAVDEQVRDWRGRRRRC